MFDLAFPIATARPATYNPRAISPSAIDDLCESIRVVGFAKPIIVCADGLLLAGHQRTKAATKLGLTHVPAFIVDGVSKADEVTFNQLHNGTDMDDAAEPVRVPPGPIAGFEFVASAEIDGRLNMPGAMVRRAIGTLLLRYGNWGCAVVTESGRVVSSPHYAVACKQIGMPCRIYRVRDDQADVAAGYFAKAYGRFSYDHLPRRSYVQTLAQPSRLREGKLGRGAHMGRGSGGSALYDTMVLKTVEKGPRVLDFGCGKGDYVRHLREQGWPIHGIEFFRRFEDAKRGSMLDTRAVHRMIDDALADVREHGPFDVVVCDYVLNSVDTEQATHDVMACLNAFCRPGGLVFFSGRTTEEIAAHRRATHSSSGNQQLQLAVQFLDENGLSATFRAGEFYYQKFYTRAQVQGLIDRYTGDPEARMRYSASNFLVTARKQIELDEATVEAALRREFDLPWPAGHTVGRAEQAVAAWRASCRSGPA